MPRGQPCLQAGIGREESDQGIRTGAAHGAVEAAGKSGNWTRTLSVWSPTTQFATASGRTPRKELGRWAGIDLTISCAQAQNSPIGAQPRPSGPFFFPGCRNFRPLLLWFCGRTQERFLCWRPCGRDIRPALFHSLVFTPIRLGPFSHDLHGSEWNINQKGEIFFRDWGTWSHLPPDGNVAPCNHPIRSSPALRT